MPISSVEVNALKVEGLSIGWEETRALSRTERVFLPQVTQLAVILLEEALARAITIVLIPDLHEQESHNRDTD